MRFFILILSLTALAQAAIRTDCVCGRKSEEGLIILQTSNHRIVNGTEVTPHKYPWMAVMMIQGQNICGGSIISDRNILTAGHCVFYVPRPKSSYWMVGSHSIKQSLGISGFSYKTADFTLHPKFKNGRMFDIFDMAMINTDRPIIFGSTVTPICLPEPYEDSRFHNKKITTAGWGKMAEDGKIASDILMETQVFLRSPHECTLLTRPIKYNTDAMICAHEHFTDACQGDSGGPIFGERAANEAIILGVVSFGDGCARDFPGIYTRVAIPQTLKWIHEMIASTPGNVCMNPSALRFFSFI